MNADRPRLLAAGAFFALVLTACTGSTDKAGGPTARHPRVLTVVNTRGTDEVTPFVNAVVKLSAGTLHLNVRPYFEKWTLSSETDAIAAVRAGKADLAVVPARAWHAAGVRSFDALIAPMEVDTMALQQRVLASDLPAQMLTGVKQLGLVGLGLLPGPIREPDGITRPLESPSDWRGARIGYSPSVVAEHSLRALGATPVPNPFQGADISTRDGIEQQTASVASNAYDGTVGWITQNVGLWPRPLVVVATAKTFASLTRNQRQALLSAGRAALQDTTSVQLAPGDDAAMCRRGRVAFVAASATQLAAMRSRFAAVYTWLRHDPMTARFLDQIDSLRAGVTPLRGEAVSCADLTTPGSGDHRVSPIDGVWEMSVSVAELHAAGSVDTLPENYGTFRWVFDRGRWDSSQTSDRASTWTHGRFTLHEGVITFFVDAAGGIAPSNANGKPGDSGSLRWSLYHGALSLGPISPHLAPSDYPLSFCIKPWRRIGNPPSSPQPTSSRPTAVAQVLDGEYVNVISASRAAQTDPSGTTVPENYGTFRLVITRGRFAFTQSNALACTWGYGWLTVDGDTLEMLFRGGGGRAPTNSVNKPGEDFRYRWSLYRGALTWMAVPGAVSPPGWTATPWVRHEGVPSAAWLDGHCPPPASALIG